MRKILTETKYGIKNPKVVAMGLGYAGAKAAAKSGGILSIVLMSGFRVIDYFLNDEKTLISLFGYLATDIIKIGIVVGASVLAATFVAGSAAFATLAIGPLVAVIGVGLLLGFALDQLDEHYNITNQLIEMMQKQVNSAKSTIENVKQSGLDIVENVIEETADYVLTSVKRTMINFVSKQFHRLARSRL